MNSVRLRVDATHRRFDVIVPRCVLQCERVRIFPGPGQKYVPQSVQSCVGRKENWASAGFSPCNGNPARNELRIYLWFRAALKQGAYAYLAEKKAQGLKPISLLTLSGTTEVVP